MQEQASLDTLFENLRRAERAARAELRAGCAQDALCIERFFERPLRIARREAAAAHAAMGTSLEDELACNLRRESFDRISTDFTRLVCANVGLRLLARFRIYTSALSAVENGIADGIAAVSSVRIDHPLPKMFALHRLAIDDVRIPPAPETGSDIEEWAKHLYKAVLEDVRTSIDASIAYVLARGAARLGVVKTRIDLVR